MSDAKAASLPNGEPQLITVRHLLTYPAVRDSVDRFQDSTLGRVSIQLSNTAYHRLAAPLLSFFNKPYYGYVAPYVQRVDELGDQTLSRVDERFPAVKKPAPELLSRARAVVYAPVRTVAEAYSGGRKHVAEVYSGSRKHVAEVYSGSRKHVAEVYSGSRKHVAEVYSGNRKHRGPSADAGSKGAETAAHAVVASGKAAVATAAVITGEGIVYTIRSLLRWGKSLRINERVDHLEAAIARQERGADATADGQPEQRGNQGDSS